mmetsp:Transcript_5042/g.20213  ORF Transcript_5042/g.20213 Transcript_5042/m.20213 type:complete len:349 (-) Transcript_5042:1464-2510(-)
MVRDRVRWPSSPHGPQVPHLPQLETTQSTSAYSECDTRRRRCGSDEDDRVSPRSPSSAKKGTSAPPSRSASRANAASPFSISSFELFCAILSTILAQSRESTSCCGALAGFILGDAFTSTSHGVGTSGTPSFPSSWTDEKSDPSSSTKSNRNVSKKCAASSGNDGSLSFSSFARAMAEATNGAAASIAATMVSVARVRTAAAAPTPYRASRNAASARHAVGASSGEPAPSRAREGTSHAAGYSRLITSSIIRSSDAKRSRVSSNSNASHEPTEPSSSESLSLFPPRAKTYTPKSKARPSTRSGRRTRFCTTLPLLSSAESADSSACLASIGDDDSRFRESSGLRLADA